MEFNEHLKRIRAVSKTTQQELADYLNVKYSSMSERLNKLENMGYIFREIDESNSKFKRIYITSTGKVAANQCRRIQNEFDNKMYKGFTKKDIKQLEFYLKKIEANVD